jgi:hypothetical protein
MSRKYPEIVHTKVLGKVRARKGFWWAHIPGSMITPGYGASKSSATKDFIGECECLYGYSPLLFTLARRSDAGGTA